MKQEGGDSDLSTSVASVGFCSVPQLPSLPDRFLSRCFSEGGAAGREALPSSHSRSSRTPG